jgi:hypothetical protein
MQQDLPLDKDLIFAYEDGRYFLPVLGLTRSELLSLLDNLINHLEDHEG